MTTGPADHGATQSNHRIWPVGHQRRIGPLTIVTQALRAPTRAARKAVAALTTNSNRVTTLDGVVFTPSSRISLEESLADTGPGHLDFAVTFPASPAFPRRRIVVRATHDRVFHDLPPINAETAAAFGTLLQASLQVTRPGDRVLLIGAGTGALTTALAEHAGPSGAVTAFESDAQSVAFARARYPVPNAAHERLKQSTLLHEPAAAAETIIITPATPTVVLPTDPTQLTTLLARPGRLLLAGSHAKLADAFRSLSTIRVESLKPQLRSAAGESALMLVSKPPAA
ncbi:MAG: hypothetical protein AAGJ54_09285 [Planctomycetota bacterium]